MDKEAPPSDALGLVNLASPRMGSKINSVSDDFFAEAPRMLADTVPVFIPDKFDNHGKWMDGWESRRRRHGGHDWCIIELGETGIVRLVDINTAHFTGNYPPGAMIEAAYCEDGNSDKAEWKQLVAETKLGPDAHHMHEAEDIGPVNMIRLNIYPDGGIARLRLFGEVVRDWSAYADTITEISALRAGGCILGYNDAHYGDVNALLSDGRGTTMGDGWETRRRREPGHDWIIVKLATAGLISEIEVDTAHFKGNYPDRCSIQAAMVTGDVSLDEAENWPELMAEQSLSADTIHRFGADKIADIGAINTVRLNIFPDGGVSRLRLFGKAVG